MSDTDIGTVSIVEGSQRVFSGAVPLRGLALLRAQIIQRAQLGALLLQFLPGGGVGVVDHAVEDLRLGVRLVPGAFGLGLFLGARLTVREGVLFQIGTGCFFLILQGRELVFRLCTLAHQPLQLGKVALSRLDLPLQRRDLAVAAVGAAEIELLFQRSVCLGIGCALFTGCNQRGNATLQLGVLIDRQTALADERAAFIDLPRHTQQRLAAVGRGQRGDGLAGAGVGRRKAAHG